MYVLCKSPCTDWLTRGLKASVVKSDTTIWYQSASKPRVSEMGVLQIGIRAKVSTLSLDGPVERSLD